MLSLRTITMIVVLAGAACADQPTGPALTLPPLTQGLEAYVTVDNAHASAGQTVRVSVLVRVAASVKVGSYTGRLHFDPSQLQLKSEVALTDGLRVSNPNGAAAGEIRFAGASATGFTTLTLYSADFVVRGGNYTGKLALQMEELSAARTLMNLAPQLRVAPQVYLSATAH